MLRTSIIAAILLAIPAQPFAMCFARPSALTILTIDHCVVTTFSRPTTAGYSGLRSVEGVLLSGTVVNSWYAWRKDETTSIDSAAPPIDFQKGSPAIFFNTAKSCNRLVGKTVDLVENLRCCDTRDRWLGPDGVCILPWSLQEVRIVSDSDLSQFAAPVNKAK